MQTAIVIVIVAVAACYLIRRFYNSVKKDSRSPCGCSCDGCDPDLKNSCIDTENMPPSRERTPR